jgi:excisionase family DNA binding protein
MNDLLSPKQVARAIDVSESSLKRWCDKGLLPTVRTAGGHRRLQISSVLEFLRQSGRPIVRPELLGLPSSTGAGERTTSRAAEQFSAALLRGDEQAARRIVFDLHLAGRTAWEICDEVMARGMHDVGDRWQCGEAQVYEEHRACEICVRLLSELRELLPEAAADAPLAIGGSWAGDPYRLPTTMVEITLREAGWNAQSFGPSLPAETLQAAVEQSKPRLLWISVSTLECEEEFLVEYDKLFAVAMSTGTAVAIGGRGLTESLRRQIRFSVYCDHLRHLLSFASSIWTLPSRTAAGGRRRA